MLSFAFVMTFIVYVHNDVTFIIENDFKMNICHFSVGIVVTVIVSAVTTIIVVVFCY